MSREKLNELTDLLKNLIKSTPNKENISNKEFSVDYSKFYKYLPLSKKIKFKCLKLIEIILKNTILFMCYIFEFLLNFSVLNIYRSITIYELFQMWIGSTNKLSYYIGLYNKEITIFKNNSRE